MRMQRLIEYILSIKCTKITLRIMIFVDCWFFDWSDLLYFCFVVTNTYHDLISTEFQIRSH